MDLGLRDQVVVVTGASKGIGLAMAKAFAHEGSLVVAGARTTDTMAGIDGVAPVAAGLADAVGPAGPGGARAAMTGTDADTARERVVAGIGGFATGRFTRPDEVAALALMLASDRIGNVTGENVVIDGGLIKTL